MRPKPYALLFPGQGSQAPGMGRALCERFPAAREVFDRADAVLGYPLTRLCFEGDEATLTQTEHAQPAIFVTSLATLAALRSLAGDRLPPPARVAGHSLGEYTAVVTGGALDFDDGLRLVRARALAMQRAAEVRPGTMAALLAIDLPGAEQACRAAAAEVPGGVVVVANDNAEGQVVISGTVEAVEAAMVRAKALGARRALRLQVGGAFHSPLMTPARQELARAIAAAPIRDLATPLLANATGRRIRSADEVRAELAEQLDSRVRWSEGIELMLAEGVATFVEVGAGPITAWLKRRGGCEAVALDTPEAVAAGWQRLLATN